MKVTEGTSIDFNSIDEVDTVMASTRYFIGRVGEQDPHVGLLHELVEIATLTAQSAELVDAPGKDISFCLEWSLGRIAMIAVDVSAYMHPNQEVRAQPQI